MLSRKADPDDLLFLNFRETTMLATCTSELRAQSLESQTFRAQTPRLKSLSGERTTKRKQIQCDDVDTRRMHLSLCLSPLTQE
mmetsp:Transcript_19949/g.41998  ORF Transcript_19949/g.41998 Transcript_19949/m.41998 type:complete len:83 (+) Transcript_19949:1373-1621(+)